MKKFILIFVISFYSFYSFSQVKQFQKVCEKNSVVAYDNFIRKYPNSEYVEEAAFKKAELLNTIEAFQNFLKLYTGNKYREIAQKNIQRIEFEVATKENTLMSLKNYIRKFPKGFFYLDVINAIEKIEVESAINTQSYDSVNKCSGKYPNNELLNAFKRQREEFDFSVARQTCSVEGYKAFLQKYPDGFYKSDIEKEIERFDFNNFKEINPMTIIDYERYLMKHKNSYFKKEIDSLAFGGKDINNLALKEALMDSISFSVKREKDWYSEYEKYLRYYPNGKFTDEANKRIEYLKSIKPEISVDYPVSITGIESPYTNVSSPIFEWKVTFYEKSGKMGYKVKGSGWYYDNEGVAWGVSSSSGITTEELYIKPGGSNIYNASFSGSRFINGYILINFTGEDAGGHPINIRVKINCK